MSIPAIPRQVFISHLRGKMDGIPAITTSMMCNPICAGRAKVPGSVCAHCYAGRGLKIYKKARERYAENTELLSSHDLEPYEIPVVNSAIARFESHGDLVNITHARNYLHIAKANPWCTFAIWTKNPGYLDKAIQQCGKPDNLICVLSSEKLNEPTQLCKRFSWVDKVFTVYDKDAVAQGKAIINCGAKSCLTCRKCYSKNNHEFYINETLK